jgi:segregation and condensation protein B
MDEQTSIYVKGAVEALLFVSDKPIGMDQFKEALEGIDAKAIRSALEELKEEHAQRKSGMCVVEIAGGYQMLSNPDYAMSIRSFYRTQKKEKLSKPALESLAIVAYKQPVTRLDIEMIRGVNSDGVVNHLLGKNLINIAGRKDVAGKPYLYGTTKEFLEYFGLRSLADLPKLEEFETIEGEPTRIEAFQQVSEQFKEQAFENAPDNSFKGTESASEASEEKDFNETSGEDKNNEAEGHLEAEVKECVGSSSAEESSEGHEEKNVDGENNEHSQTS